MRRLRRWVCGDSEYLLIYGKIKTRGDPAPVRFVAEICVSESDTPEM
jgi:hypothetical protein